MSGEGIVVVGGGHGGSQTAASLRADGYDGKLTLVCAEKDVPYQRPPLSKAFLKDMKHDLLPLRPESFYARNAIDLRLGVEAVAIDRRDSRVSLSDGSAIPFSGLALATGARPRRLTVAGADLDGALPLRVAEDARRIRDRLHASGDVVVIGGGFIGLEIAATARLMGKAVTILEAVDRLMGRLVAPEISRYFLALHRGWGSAVKLGAPVGRIVGEGGRVVAVETAGGERIAADLAIVGIGAVPNVELAEAARLAVANGVTVDECLTTSDPRIVAIGDLANFHHWQIGRRVRLESVQNAVDQGKTAARTLLGRREPFREVPWFWSDQGDVKLQMVGLSFDATRSVTRGRAEDGSFSIFHYAGERLVGIDSVNRAADHVVGRRLLAAGTSLAPEIAADEGADLKALVGGRLPAPS